MEWKLLWTNLVLLWLFELIGPLLFPYRTMQVIGCDLCFALVWVNVCLCVISALMWVNESGCGFVCDLSVNVG
jgi:hypothetical protein